MGPEVGAGADIMMVRGYVDGDWNWSNTGGKEDEVSDGKIDQVDRKAPSLVLIPSSTFTHIAISRHSSANHTTKLQAYVCWDMQLVGMWRLWRPGSCSALGLKTT